jgi:ankyrin repeat protein
MLRFGFPIHNALFDAAWNGQLEIARLLIENGASARLRHLVHHVTPVAFANRAGHFDVRDYLLEQDVDIFDAIRFERPDLVARVAAVIRGDVEAVQLLLAAGANRDACDHRGRSLIQIAASEDLPEIAALL